MGPARTSDGRLFPVLARVGPRTIADEKVRRFPDLQVDPVAEFVEERSHKSPSALRSESADRAILAQGQERIRVLPANCFKAAARAWPADHTFADRVAVDARIVD